MKVDVRHLVAASLAALITMVAVGAQQATTASHTHLMAVVSKGLPGVTIYDADTDKEICKVKTEVSPHEAAFSRDGRTLYLPIYSSANVGAPGTDEHVIHFIRTSDCQIVSTMDTGDYKRPHFAVEAPSGLLYVTAELKNSILVIDPKQQKVVATIPTGSPTTHFFAMTSDEKKMFTSNVGAATLSVLDIPARQVVKVLPTTGSNQRMTVSPDDKWFVTSLGQPRQVAFYRTADATLDFAVQTDGSPFVARFSPDGKFVYDMGNAPRGATPAGIRVWKIDVASRQVVATSSEALGNGTGGMQISPFNGKVYIAAYSGQITALDPNTLKIAGQIQGEATPDGLFFATVQ
jgi:YVTN family beta-propeller protein